MVASKPFIIGRKSKMEVKEETRTKKKLFLTFLTIFGLKQNNYAQQLVQDNLTMDTLFSS